MFRASNVERFLQSASLVSRRLDREYAIHFQNQCVLFPDSVVRVALEHGQVAATNEEDTACFNQKAVEPDSCIAPREVGGTTLGASAATWMSAKNPVPDSSMVPTCAPRSCSLRASDAG